MKYWISLIIAFLTSLPCALFANEHLLNVSDKPSSESQVESLFTSDELRWLEKNPVLTYVYDPSWAPFEWKNNINNHTGIIADILILISKRTGIVLRPVHTDTWEESVEAVKSGKADMFSAITHNSSREGYLAFTSKDVYSYPAVLVTKFKDKTVYLNIEKDFKGKKIGIVKSSGLGRYIQEKYPELVYVELSSTDDGFSSIRNNMIDLFAINTVSAKYYIEKKGFSDLKIALKLDYIYHLKIAIRKNMPSEIISVLDKTLSSISEEELNEIFNKWTEISIEKQTDWELLFQITGALLIIILFLLWGNRKLNLMVAIRTEELVSKNIELRKAEDRAIHANQAKSQFLSSMSHELRTPLNAILGFSQLLKMDAKNDNEKDNFNEIIIAGNHLLELINEILDLSRIEAGKLEIYIVTKNLNILLNECISIIKPAAEKNSIKIENKVVSSSNYSVKIDVKRFKQVMLNLLSNAIKYNNEKGRVIIDCMPVDVNMLQLSVIDTGHGLSPEEISKIFEPFERVGADHSHIEGTGLGLLISKDLVELMGGSIGVESEIGTGSRFWIKIPLL